MPDRHRLSPAEVSLSARVGRGRLLAPVAASSGCAGFGRELARFVPLDRIGAVVTKSVLTHPRPGRPSPRMLETSSGMLNGIGLQGPGIDHLLAVELPWLREQGARPIVSIAGGTAAEFAQLAGRLADAPGLSMVELNISCPNVERRGEVFATSPRAAAEVVRAVRTALRPDQSLLAKLTADVTDIVAVAEACVAAGADGLSLINSLLGLGIDTRSMAPALSGVTGGLTGPAIKPVALRAVWQVHEAMPAVPILGGGGIRSGLDALEFILAGASAVSVGTANFADPTACVSIAEELRAELAARGLARLDDAVGLAHRRAQARPAPVAALVTHLEAG